MPTREKLTSPDSGTGESRTLPCLAAWKYFVLPQVSEYGSKSMNLPCKNITFNLGFNHIPDSTRKSWPRSIWPGVYDPFAIINRWVNVNPPKDKFNTAAPMVAIWLPVTPRIVKWDGSMVGLRLNLCNVSVETIDAVLPESRKK